MAGPVPILFVGARTGVADCLATDPGASRYKVTKMGPVNGQADDLVQTYPVVVIDTQGQPDAVDLIRQMRKLNRELICVLVCDADSEKTGVEAVRAGAFDYFVWPPNDKGLFFSLLGRCLSSAEPGGEFEPEDLGRYRLVRKLGQGGMAEVFLAERIDEPTQERFVLKRMLPRVAKRREFVDMFMDEAKISALLNHRNIVATRDFGRVGDHLFIVLDYVPGWSLEHLGRWSKWQVPMYVACYIVSELAAALGHAHTKPDLSGVPLGIVHRDVNPPNVLISLDGAVKLTDFGIAKAKQRYTESTSGLRKGKISYMSPEQASGKPIDHRSDIFSLGVMLYRLLTGALPFYAATPFDRMVRIRNGAFDPPTTVNPAVPAKLEAVVCKALEREPANRYANANELEWVLRSFMRHELERSDIREWSLRVAKAQRITQPPTASTRALSSTAQAIESLTEDGGLLGEESVGFLVGRLDEVLREPEKSTDFAVPDELEPSAEAAYPQDKYSDAFDEPLEALVRRVLAEDRAAREPLGESTVDAIPIAPAEVEPEYRSDQPLALEVVPVEVEVEELPRVPHTPPAKPRSRTRLVVVGVALLLALIASAAVLGPRLFREPVAASTTTPPTGTPTPVATTVAVATPEPTVFEATTPARTTLAPTVRQTPGPTRVVVKPTPKPSVTTRKTGTGTLSIWTDVWAEIEIDGKSIGKRTPIFGLQLSAGRHKVVLINAAANLREERWVTIRAGQESKLTVKLRE